MKDGVFMEFSDKILNCIKDCGIQPSVLAREIGIDKSTFSKWKSKPTSKLDLDILVKIASYLNISIDNIILDKPNNIASKSESSDLSCDEAELLKYYKQLPENEKNRLIRRAEAIADMYAEAAPEPAPPMIVIKHSMYKVSAGTGERLSDSDDWDEIEIPDTPEARRADFCLTIYGNSMEPVYYDGDIVLVKQQNAVERGQIGIFIIEGSGYIKKFGGDRLISLNDQYDDIMFSEYDPDDIRCSGLVIGRV